ncbi:MAG: BREX system ATP-binding domain-containing protein [candidate division WOR-3 bacterium]
MKSSKLVSHPVFGEGEVIDSRWQGTELLVRFQTGLRLWLPKSRVRFLVEVDESLLDEAVAGVSGIDRVSACRMIEAFRLGIVPHQDVELFTFGRDEELKLIDRTLDGLVQGRGDVLMLEGEYGTGKTHLLELVHHRALKAGMVTSLVQFDPVEVSPHRPKRVYRELVRNIRLLHDGRECGFRELLRMATQLDLSDHVFFGPLLRKLRRLDSGSRENEVFWQWVEAESTKEYATEMRSPYRVRGAQGIPALYDYSTAADFYCNIICAISYISRQLGLKGLVLLLDEAETVTRLWDIVYLSKSINFMEGLVRMALNDPQLRQVSDRLIHNQVRPVPYIYREPALLLIFATTPCPGEYGYLRLVNSVRHRVELRPLSDQALANAWATMVRVYERAYPGFKLDVAEQKRMLTAAVKRSGTGVRTFIKFCVEGLDVARLRQAGVLPQVAVA